MIRTQELSKSFYSDEIETLALNKVNVAIEKGEFIAVMGPSGCGKTTLLNILGLLDSPTIGKYWFDGIETSGLNDLQKTRLRKGRIGFVFQSFNLIEELSVYQNIELPLLYLGISSRERKRNVAETMEKLRIAHRRKYYPNQLSGGQQQKVAIARAIITKPILILADEPTGNLDSLNGEEIMELITGLNIDGTTIVMVTHSVTYADRAHRVIQLFDGRIVSENLRKAI